MLKIVVPMSGEGKRFVERGFSFPKPLIEIAGKPMIEIVVRNLTPAEPHEFIFLCREEHLQTFALTEVLRLIAPTSRVVPVRNATSGALCSVLLAIDFLDPTDELLIANADQYVDVSVANFLSSARAGFWDGYIMTFPSTHPKWSYVKVEADNVVAVAEKRPISRQATTGIYYFRLCEDFLAGAERILLKNAAVGGEFYICPVFNELILAGKRLGIFAVDRDQMHSLGTPEDVEAFAATKAPSLEF